MKEISNVKIAVLCAAAVSCGAASAAPPEIVKVTASPSLLTWSSSCTATVQLQIVFDLGNKGACDYIVSWGEGANEHYRTRGGSGQLTETMFHTYVTSDPKYPNSKRISVAGPFAQPGRCNGATNRDALVMVNPPTVIPPSCPAHSSPSTTSTSPNSAGATPSAAAKPQSPAGDKTTLTPAEKKWR